jgi:large subunit ribosomal protein L27
MSKKKAGGKITQHVSPEGKRLGIKLQDGTKILPGMIIVRQRGTQVGAGTGVKVGRDHTLYSVAHGVVRFGTKLGKKVVSVVAK